VRAAGAGVQVEYALDSLERAMKWDEEVYGLEYDLDLFNIVAVDDFNMVGGWWEAGVAGDCVGEVGTCLVGRSTPHPFLQAPAVSPPPRQPARRALARQPKQTLFCSLNQRTWKDVCRPLSPPPDAGLAICSWTSGGSCC
jgi:hypothetical protein